MFKVWSSLVVEQSTNKRRARKPSSILVLSLFTPYINFLLHSNALYFIRNFEAKRKKY